MEKPWKLKQLTEQLPVTIANTRKGSPPLPIRLHLSLHGPEDWNSAVNSMEMRNSDLKQLTEQLPVTIANTRKGSPPLPIRLHLSLHGPEDWNSAVNAMEMRN